MRLRSLWFKEYPQDAARLADQMTIFFLPYCLMYNQSNANQPAAKLFDMEPKRFGRTLGIGVRVASNILRDRASKISRANESPEAVETSAGGAKGGAYVEKAREVAAFRGAAARETAQKSRALGRGAKKFGQAFWGPFSHAGGLLWLEITGLFFALFALFFAQNVYRTHTSWRQGPEHTHFLLYVALTLIFVWFSTSSFLRARKRSKKTR
jgi:hypothetical protein